MKLVLIIESMQLKGGGAEKTISIMANYWVKHNVDITIITFDYDKNKKTFFKLNPKINLLSIGNGEEIIPLLNKYLPSKFLKRIFALKTLLKEITPDAVISFMDITNIFSIFAARLARFPIIISDRNNPFLKKIKPYWKLLRKISYPLANKLIVLTEEQIGCYPDKVQEKAGAIPCIIEAPQFDKMPVEFEKPFILSVGRLRKQKGHDILINAFAEISDQYPEWKVVVLGEGVERKSLEKQIKDLNLNDQIFLPGCIKNPQDIIKQSEFFVFPSRWEGLGNALLEAMSCGTAVIATDCDFGPKSYVRNGIDGIIVSKENVIELSQAMEKLMTNKSLRQKYGKNAKEILTRFSLEKVMKMWEKQINEVIHSK